MNRCPALILGALVLLTGCPGPSAPVDVEVLHYDLDAQEWKLMISTLETVRDLDHLTGDYFDLLGNQFVAPDALANPVEDPAEATVENMRESMYERPGEEVQLAYDFVTENGRQVAKANDYESLAMMTVFHDYEKVWIFFRDVVLDSSSATTQRTIVGFYAQVGATIGIPIPVLSSDNAAYVSLTDSFVVLRTGLVGGVPLSLNAGVIAHEFSHRVFHHNVFGGAAFSNWYIKENVEAQSRDAVDTRTSVLLSALNEGMSDINGTGFTHRANFIADSLQGALAEGTRLQRDLEGEFADYATYENMKYDGFTPSGFDRDVCGGGSDDYSRGDWNFYCLGTIWARALWDGAGRDVEVLKADILPALNRAERRLGDQLAAEWHFDFDQIIDLTVLEAPAGRQAALCAAFTAKFAELMPQVASCP